MDQAEKAMAQEQHRLNQHAHARESAHGHAAACNGTDSTHEQVRLTIIMLGIPRSGVTFLPLCLCQLTHSGTALSKLKQQTGVSHPFVFW